MRNHTLALLSLTVALMAASCTSQRDESAPEPAASASTGTLLDDNPATTAAAATISATSAATPRSVIDPSLDQQIAWVLAMVNGAPVEVSDVDERFSDLFLAQVPADQLIGVITQLRAGVSPSWTETERVSDGRQAQIDVNTAAGRWRIVVAIDNDGLIETLLFQPAEIVVEDPPATFDELAARLGEFGEVAILAADVANGSCAPDFALDAAVPKPIGSVFKLYVLGAVANAVASGELGWETPVTIRDELKSLPSGAYQNLAAGTERTVRESAEAMIAISDNTATDHLIDLVGREAVEQAQLTYGHQQPELNEPFLTTREVFVLKLGLDDAGRAAYVAAGPDERRRILADDIAAQQPELADAAGWTNPRAILEIEWLASNEDLCRALLTLIANAAEPALTQIRDILGANPGAPLDPSEWSYVGFKGGSEPGVLSLAWYAEPAGGGAWVYVVNVTNPKQPIPESEAAAIAAIGLDLLTR